ncbi:TrmH family RNA methyltransferase [bacterium]|nr:TrmH family RNA methyltransferase [bacterium]
MSDFAHQRHKIPTKLDLPRELIVACVPMRSNVNISQIARTASACAVEKMIICGAASLIPKIARDATSVLSISTHRSLSPVLKKLKQDCYRIVGIEQASNSQNIHHFAFERRTVLVIGNERLGINDEILTQLDDVIEIPVWGLPHSYNAGSAANMALYEYCRQFPEG